ncbi:hypothetical protein HDU83_004430 [Entophlyctis luteolus]|nr:hypothetical protein HDU82_004302 [Entophlyctis luteolus]KAJ3345095.1 hypothetical protein HDU83_004430 [Entophlyctis luteolus]
MPDMSSPDNAILLACVAITTVTIVGCVYRMTKSFSYISVLLLIANLIYLSNNIITLIYNNINWLNSPFRYFAVYFTIDAPVIIFYYLYTERLCVLLSGNLKTFFRIFMFFSLGVYIACCVSQITLFAKYGTLTSSGGYSSNGTGLFEVKMAVMSVDLIIASIILLMTMYAVFKLVNVDAFTNSNSKSPSSFHVYWTILTSDAAKFIIVFAVDIYKATGSVNPNVGVLPVGNLGFSHILDATKVSLMTLGLILPAVYKPSTKGKSSSNRKQDTSRNYNPDTA